MKLTKSKLTKIINEVIAETDGYPKLLNKNKEVAHNWATHMEWKSSTDKKRYGNMIGEVKHHTLYEDGSITHYDVKFGNKLIKSIPANLLETKEMQKHKHAIEKLEKEKEDKE